MPLLFKPPADPLKATASAVSHVIESDALQRLTKEIERYGKGELAGRSILIAGHRGVGKTTLVRKAIENAQVRLRQSRPFFVDLHGPDLLAPPDKDLIGTLADSRSVETAKNGDAKVVHTNSEGEKQPVAGGDHPRTDVKEGDSGTDSSPKHPAGADLQSFVERLTFSLYRAAVKEFVESFRALCNNPGAAGESRYREYGELAEQFALELDGSTDLGRIRMLYERVGALDEGVLPVGNDATGSQELALLAASSQAYRIISGKLDEDQSQQTSGKNAVNWSMAADNLLSPITGLVTGSLAWAALPGGFSPLAKLFTSFTAGLASTIAMKFTRTIQRESQQSSKVSFVPQRDRLALRRLLPVLVDRFCDVGLPPIFVVDELDKVQNISERMEDLMGFLKQFVTERAFFCFLVDRDYYERLEATVSTSAFPKEATLFGDRLFVQYAPESAHTYLKNITKVETLALGESQDDASRDLEVLRYVLLRRSYMHPFDLRREISRCTNAKNEFRFPPRALFNVQQYRNEVYYQVAVECVLAGEKLIDFAEDPNHAQLLYDALYFPIRTKKLPAEFDSSQKVLKSHLASRMGKENRKLLSAGDEDLGILHAALLELVQFLCAPRTLLETMQILAVAKYLPEPKVFPPAVVGVIEAAAGPKSVADGSPASGDSQSPDAAGDGTVSSGPANGSIPPPITPVSPPQSPIAPVKAAPLLAKAGVGKYRWQFDKYGYPLAPKVPLQAEGAVQTKGAVPDSPRMGISTATVASLLRDFEDASRLLEVEHGRAIDIELWERMRILPTPPTWSYLREAADAFRNPFLPATRVEEYNKAFIEYRSNLQSAFQAIWWAVAIAATMAVNNRESSSTPKERRSLEILAEVLADAPSRDQMLAQLKGIAQDAIRGYGFPDPLPANAGYRKMLDAIESSANTMRIRSAMSAEDVALKSKTFYENWFMQFYEGRRPMVNALWPFLSLVMNTLPRGLRKIDPLRMTIGDWTQSAMEPQNRWSIVSLERLGFRRNAEAIAVLNTEDSVLRALVQSIRKRGYEKASVILQPQPQTLTQAWRPSESIACHIGWPNMKLDVPPKYSLFEVPDWPNFPPSREELAKISIGTRVAFFGPDSLPPDPTGLRSYPCIMGPKSLDDLVERLDALPASDWPDAKLALPPRPN